MKLDDRPVIEQLLNPTPLNILAEVHAESRSAVDGQEHITAKSVLDVLRQEVDGLGLDLSPATLADLDAALSCAADELAEMVSSNAYDAVDEFVAALGARL